MFRILVTAALLTAAFALFSAFHAGNMHTEAVFACVGDRAPTQAVLAECAPQ